MKKFPEPGAFFEVTWVAKWKLIEIRWNLKFGLSKFQNGSLTSKTSEEAQWKFPKNTCFKSGKSNEKNELYLGFLVKLLKSLLLGGLGGHRVKKCQFQKFEQKLIYWLFSRIERLLRPEINNKYYRPKIQIDLEHVCT